MKPATSRNRTRVYLVSAHYDHEGTVPLRAFVHEEAAKRFQQGCYDYVAKVPNAPPIEDTEENDRLWERHMKRVERFAKRHPAGSHVCAIFVVERVELHQ